MRLRWRPALIGLSFLLLTPLQSAYGARRPASHHGAPPPLQCAGARSEALGHALVIAPSLKGIIKKSDRKKLDLLAGQDPVQLSNILKSFEDGADGQIMDIRTDAAGFKSLQHFIDKKSFKGDAVVEFVTQAAPAPAPAAKESKQAKEAKPEPKSKLFPDKAQDKIDVSGLTTEIKAHWKARVNKTEILFVQMKIADATVIAALEYHDGVQECLKTAAAPLPAQSIPAEANPGSVPDHYLFKLPVEPPFTVTYFFGPRIFNSMNSSLALERDPDRPPVAVTRSTDKPFNFLNKYWNFHSGIDFSASTGTPVYAPYDGIVFAVGRMGCAGNTVIIAHSLPESHNIVFSVYEHLMAGGYAKVVEGADKSVHLYKGAKKKGEVVRSIRVGDPIKQGDLVAKSGKSGDKIGFSRGFKDGCVGGAHLHYEIRAPKKGDIDLEKEMVFTSKALSKSEMDKRFRFVQSETVAINPADFIYMVDEACQVRKKLELENAEALLKAQPKAIPPLTAGYCGMKFEKSLKSEPSLYRLTRHKTAPEDLNELADQKPVTSPNAPSSKPL